MQTPYVEADCTFTFEGGSFTSGGAVVTDQYIIGYCSGDMKELRTWHGETIAPLHVRSAWRTPRSFISERMYQVEVVHNGIRYTGRTNGASMFAKLRRCTKQ